MIAAWQGEKHAFFTLIRQQVSMIGVEYECTSSIFRSRACTVLVAVYCERYEFRYYYNHSVETFQNFELYQNE